MRRPLCVDMDGALLKTDLFYETLVASVRQRPWVALVVPFWLLRGRAYAFSKLDRGVGEAVDVDALPLNDDLVDYLRRERATGRRIVLMSSSDGQVAQRVALRVGCPDRVVKYDAGTSPSIGRARVLSERFPHGFVYAGGAPSDLVVWDRAAGAVPVGAALAHRDAVRARAPIEAEFGSVPRVLGPLARGLRPHQWSKNALVLLPLLLTRGYEDPAALIAALAVVVLFCLAASGTYLLNDLLDLSADRSHPNKRTRPLASGGLSLATALWVALGLILTSLAGAAAIGVEVLLCLVGYLAITLLYSFVLKSVAVVDVLALGILFTFRILAGHLVLNIGSPLWLLVFSVAFFTSLALLKRMTEVRGLESRELNAIPGRGYRSVDAHFVLALGLGAGLASVMVFIFYLMAEPDHVGRLSHPQLLWVVPVVLGGWLPWVWMLAARGEMHHDPVMFALRDRVSQVLGAAALLAVLAAG